MTPEHPILTLFLAEAESGKATRRSLAVLYALIIAGGDHITRGDWTRVNGAVTAALGLPGLIGVKKLAWDIHDATAIRQQALLPAATHDAPRAVQ
jgi:hypothetical protein